MVRAVCKMRSASYGSKHTSQPLFDTTFCAYTLLTRILLVICGRSTYQMTALLSEMSIFCVRTGCEIWMASHASKHASQSLSNKISFPCVTLWALFFPKLFQSIFWLPAILQSLHVLSHQLPLVSTKITKGHFMWKKVALTISQCSFPSSVHC